MKLEKQVESETNTDKVLTDDDLNKVAGGINPPSKPKTKTTTVAEDKVPMNG